MVYSLVYSYQKISKLYTNFLFEFLLINNRYEFEASARPICETPLNGGAWFELKEAITIKRGARFVFELFLI